MDPNFLDKLGLVNSFEIDEEKVRLLHEEVITKPDWDPFQGGKTFPPAEILCFWMVAICTFHMKKADLRSTLNEIEEKDRKKTKEKAIFDSLSREMQVCILSRLVY